MDTQKVKEPFLARRGFSIRRGVYVLPSLFTLANMVCGFYAIVLAIHGDFLNAALAIIAAYVADALDGRIARMTGTTSEFGVEFDSLADLCTFCIAPAILIYMRWLSDIPRLGWVCAFVYVACGAIRLARFNAHDTTTDSTYFNGLPSPVASAGAVSLILLDERIFPGETHAATVAPWACVIMAILMVSSIRYPSFKNFKLEGRVPLRFLVAVVFLLFIFISKFYVAFTTTFIVYLLSGPFIQLSFYNSRRQARRVLRNEEGTAS